MVQQQMMAGNFLEHHELQRTNMHMKHLELASQAQWQDALPDVLPGSIDPFSDDGWDNADPDVHIECLMPNGIVVPLDVPKDETLEDIKEKLWESRFPLRGTLRDMSQYVFQCVTPQAEAIELLDESCSLLSVRPVFRVLRVIEREGDKHEKLRMSQIGNLIGKNLHDFESLNNSAEVNEFRSQMRELCTGVARGMESYTWEQRMQYSYPCAVSRQPEVPQLLLSKLPPDGKMPVVLEPRLSTEHQAGYVGTTFRVAPTMTTQDLVRLMLMKMMRNSQVAPAGPPSDYTLKVLGRQQYLIGDLALWRFAPTQEALCRGVRLRLLLVENSSIPLPDWEPLVPNQQAGPDLPRAASAGTLLRRRPPRALSSWDITQDFSMTVRSVANLPAAAAAGVAYEIGLVAALFCGGKQLCESQSVNRLAAPSDGSVLIMEQHLQFEVQVRDLPRMTRLSLAIFDTARARQPHGGRSGRQDNGGRYYKYLGWVNTPVYDYRGQLRSGDVTLYLWPYQEQSAAVDEPLQPLATAVANPDRSDAIQISVCFASYCKPHGVVLYPPVENMQLYVDRAAMDGPAGTDSHTDLNFFGRGNTEQVKQGLAAAFESNMRALDLTDHDKKVLWSLRHQCHVSHPNALPKLLQCVDWSSHLEVAEMTLLLESWQPLAPDKSLALLDVNIADPTVRQFAVRCLEMASDEELQLYLLQLVQALNHENYLFSKLAEFLLTRAVRSRAIGHWLFWHLRAEMDVPAVRVRNALLLEAYCRAAPRHMLTLTRQLEALKALTDLSVKVQEQRASGVDKEKIKESIKERIKTTSVQNKLVDFSNPLDQTAVCKKLRLETFTYFESKMTPFRLIFESVDEGGDPINLIFKSGDDLRQDMLTLQTIRIIDKLWKDEGYDLRLNAYGCIATGPRVGMIELVQDAKTVANIHKEKGMFKPTAAFRRDTIFKWLRDCNRSEEELRRAVREFSLSCAGYSVITFVLGIADRHSDNMMVKENGQLLHIDFGHILGHFKKKFGIRRERVPFVLTSDFVYVITGGDKPDDSLFEEFRRNCEQAYMILRRHKDFIISLFGMMISTGLPDVSSEHDISFLQSTLQLGVSEEEARKFFREKFDEALKKSLNASLNNAIHVMWTDNTG
ncbi:phosphatidylinositol 4,5-bisphosphate 3-kinase catalytic subunit beta isoform-like [Pollicipes pollicipes]|uniref:phosphatidylinositol 4,5-bisphosphate 3-kinase catalytic subunit beta isoform-like n=1 Tax=Pollicipes pollicipes TaxID=41117 RepID=UPI0018853232|nr:phosphatidylinositol 4,5-bisphosphate 3-kinase catalytic subunit beta isoform-like [Pollicipes pollicipes]